MERKKLEFLMSIVLVLCAFILAHGGWKQAGSSKVTGQEKKTVVVDAGHGGRKQEAVGWRI